MTFAIPWIVGMIVLPILGAVYALARPGRARGTAIALSVAMLALASGAVWEFTRFTARVDPWDPGVALRTSAWFGLDDTNAVMMLFAAVLVLFIAVVTPLQQWRSGTAARLLVSQSCLFGALAARTDVALVAFWILSAFPMDRELRASERGRRCCRALRLSSLVGAVVLTAGVAVLHVAPENGPYRTAGAALILCAAMIRQGIIPFHSWLPHFFANGPLPAALLYFIPQWGLWAAARVMMPAAPDVLLMILGAASSATSLYAAGIALVEKDARRAFGWLCLSELSLVFASLEGSSVVGLTGGLLMAFSSGLSLAGLGMALCALEIRRGRLSLADYAGGHESTPRLAAAFLLLGLCSVGFPGTLGFVGADLLVDGTVSARPQLGVVLVVATVINGLSVVRMYFRLFCGRRIEARPEFGLRPREHAGYMTIVVLLALLGLLPQWLLASRYRAAQAILATRTTPSAVGTAQPESTPHP